MANNNKKYVSLARLSNFLDNIKARYALIGHKHTIKDITDYVVDSELNPNSSNPVQNKVLNTEFDAISQAMQVLDAAIDDKADSTHDHNSAYYQKNEIDQKLSNKSDKNHNHDSAYADIDHNHDGVYSLDSHKHTVSEISDLTATATELNYMDGVTSNVQAQLDNKAPSSHEHSAYKITSGILSTEYGGTGNTCGYVQAGAQEGSSVGAVATAEGRETIASGSYSHAEGNYTEATGLCAHSEGQTTKASGNMSHAQGESTEAKGKRSHAEGDHTVASGENQHVQGKYNVEDEDGVYAHIVGNGDWKTRSNAHTIDWNGNAWFAGDIFVGGASQDDISASKVITKADQRWNLLYDSGEISAIANSISNIDVSGYTNIQVLVRCYNDGDSINSRAGSAIFTCTNGKTYQFPVWSSMFSKSINTVYTMATFNLVDGWLVCPYASRLIGDASTFDDEGGTAGNLALTGSGMMKCTSQLSTLTISSLDQNSNYYFGMGSRVMVWGWNA